MELPKDQHAPDSSVHAGQSGAPERRLDYKPPVLTKWGTIENLTSGNFGTGTDPHVTAGYSHVGA